MISTPRIRPLATTSLAALVAVAAGVWAARTAPGVDPLSLVAGALALLLVVAILRQPVAGLVAFALVATLLPFAVVPLRLLVAPTFVDLTLLTTLAAWLAQALRRTQPVVRTPVDGWLLGLLGVIAVAAILGTALTPLDAETLRLLLKLAAGLLCFFSATQLARSQHSIAELVQILIAGGTAAAVIAIAIYALPRADAIAALTALGPLGYPTGADVIRTVAGTDVVRATGTSVDPNVLGGMLLITTLLGVGCLLAPQPASQRAVLGGALALMIAAIGLSGSRSAWVGLATGALFIGVTKERRVLILGALLAAALAITPPGQAVVARLLEAVRLQDPATVERLGEYRNALAIITAYPAFGIGFGTSAGDVDAGVGVSSLYLQLAEQTGLVGLAIFLVLVALALYHGFTVRLTARSSAGSVLAGLQAAVLGALVAGLFDHYFFNVRFPHMAALFWFTLALLLTAAREAREASRASEARQGLRGG